MKRMLISAGIVSYLGVLFYGLFCHAFYYKVTEHPAMYFIIWDMYCGWSGYEARQHVIGEGVSGARYELCPGPWGAFQPFADLDRRHHDYHGVHCMRLAMNTLRHTEHEPITRIYVVEELWPRKYNLPDHLWAKRYPEPKDPMSYYQTRSVYTGDGQLVQTWPTWLARAAQDCVLDNPRLRQDMQTGRPFYAVDPVSTSAGVVPAGYELPVAP